MKPWVAPLACVALLLPGIASAFQPLVTDDTGTQGAGGNQVEVAYSRTVDKAPGAKAVTHEGPLVFARGITDALDLYAGIGYQRIVPDAPPALERGWGNPVLGAKWRFHESDASKLSFALRPEIAFAVSEGKEARGLGTARSSEACARRRPHHQPGPDRKGEHGLRGDRRDLLARRGPRHRAGHRAQRG